MFTVGLRVHTAIDEFAIERLGRRLRGWYHASKGARIVSWFELAKLAKESDPPHSEIGTESALFILCECAW